MGLKLLRLIYSVVLSFFLITQFCGCKNKDLESDPFRLLYTRDLNLSSDVVSADSPIGEKYTFSADGMPFPLFMRWLSDRSGFGFVAQEGIESKTVSIEIKNATIEEIFDTVSRSLKLNYLRIGNTFFIGDIRKEDRCVFVRKIKSVSRDFLHQSLLALLSETGKCAVSQDCIAVVSDVPAVLLRVSEICDKVETVSSGTWILQFYITLQKKTLDLDVGAKVNTSGAVSYALAKGQGEEKFSFTDSESISQNVEMVLQTKSEHIKLVSAPLMLLRDGSFSEWYDGITIPVPQYSISQYGVRTVSGYKDYKAGFSLRCQIRETLYGCVLECKYESSNIVGYTESIPHLSKSSLQFNTELRSGRIYLVGELMNDQRNNSLTNVFQFGKDDSYTKVQIWCRAYQVKDFIGKVQHLK